MKKIFRMSILGLLAFIIVTAFIKSEVNGKSFWYNAGYQVRSAVVFVVDKTKDVLSDAKDGYKE